MSPNLLFTLSISAIITGMIAFSRQHWSELGVMIFIAVFSMFGFVLSLMGKI